MRPVASIFIRVVSALLLTDRLRFAAARWAILWNKPLARRHLLHYLKGKGVGVSVDTAALLEHDAGIRETLLHAIAEGLRQGQDRGRFTLTQLTYATPDWCYTLGGMEMDWRTLTDGSVGVGFVGRYHWSPTERCISQPLHRAAERMKTRGAAEFEILGRETRIDRSKIANAIAKPIARHDRRFYV